MFIYRDRNKQQELDNSELKAINQKLKERRERKYVAVLKSNIGNNQKIVQVSEVLYFRSKDHYTHAYTPKGEYIVDYSIKSLTEELESLVYKNQIR